MASASAPGKVILLGEHAVVYGRPAIAVPVWQVTARAAVLAGEAGSGCVIWARDVDLRIALRDADGEEPLALVTRLALERLGITAEPDWRIELQSSIPIASGLGSGAALSTALVRALFAQAGHIADPATISSLVYESERLYHGTPSGIDNTVIAYGVPIWFVRGQPPAPFAPSNAFTLVIADSGIRSPTKETVGDVRRGWQADPAHFEALFDAIADLVTQARPAIEGGDFVRLGELMNADQALLEQLGVSSPPLEQMIAAARRAGAWGAKLSGGGRGGNIIAVVDPAQAEAVAQAVAAAGAARTLTTPVDAVSASDVGQAKSG